jgi:hypothetical protein
METLDLPLLHLSTAPKVALERMREARRSAVIASDDWEGYVLLPLGSVLTGLREGHAGLEGAPDPAPVHVFRHEEVASHGLDLVAPWRTADAFEAALDGAGTLFGLLGIAHRTGVAFVVTRHEGLADRPAEGPVTCYCTVDPDRHIYERDEVEPGAPCRLRDGGEIHCE